MLHEDDFILRAVKRLAEAIVRALGLASKQKIEQARDTIREAAGSVFGLELSTLAMVDAQTAASMLGDVRRVIAYAELLEALAQIETLAGHRELAQRHLVHALSLIDTTSATDVRERLEERLRALAG